MPKADVFDVYRGVGVAEGHKSVAISVTLQPKERTLTDAEIEATVAKIVAEVAEEDRRDAARLIREAASRSAVSGPRARGTADAQQQFQSGTAAGASRVFGASRGRCPSDFNMQYPMSIDDKRQ